MAPGCSPHPLSGFSWNWLSKRKRFLGVSLSVPIWFPWNSCFLISKELKIQNHCQFRGFLEFACLQKFFLRKRTVFSASGNWLSMMTKIVFWWVFCHFRSYLDFWHLSFYSSRLWAQVLISEFSVVVEIDALKKVKNSVLVEQKTGSFADFKSENVPMCDLR